MTELQAIAVEEERAKGKYSPREIQVLQCLAEGMTNSQIALYLGIRIATVKGTHLRNLKFKMGMGDRAGMVAIAFREGVIL